ncbi:hypothetical protein GobsT_61850 [Gemmata obscuriglobus]|uniref:Uncharacterized protein n=1 Tax=Gemmata obscuriglobus TaxID=114 RepID=A0A2Z3GP66_9BACT|nr:hypothetical protein [Gemmata obscuriglobus]AWM36059.1 hypothetical protein C1280_02905 [Gemmata obscuriglobus]QEG31364.1 hypothetical protein GobsT_61850 [Gemmata obscuriglobus]VTS10704.1 unnamed protein product [Gemmata obscuriglobus UQM 2246]
MVPERAFTRWCIALSLLWVFANWPSTSGLGGFWLHAGFPFTFAWGAFGRFEHFDVRLLLADVLFGLLTVVGIAWLCARSRGHRSPPAEPGAAPDTAG